MRAVSRIFPRQKVLAPTALTFGQNGIRELDQVELDRALLGPRSTRSPGRWPRLFHHAASWMLLHPAKYLWSATFLLISISHFCGATARFPSMLMRTSRRPQRNMSTIDER